VAIPGFSLEAEQDLRAEKESGISPFLSIRDALSSLVFNLLTNTNHNSTQSQEKRLKSHVGERHSIFVIYSNSPPVWGNFIP
jgi:hypothetical protein